MITKAELEKLKLLAGRGSKSKRIVERVCFDDGSISYEIHNDEIFVSFHERGYKEPMRAKFDAELFSEASPDTITRLVEALELATESLKRISTHDTLDNGDKYVSYSQAWEGVAVFSRESLQKIYGD